MELTGEVGGTIIRYMSLYKGHLSDMSDIAACRAKTLGHGYTLNFGTRSVQVSSTVMKWTCVYDHVVRMSQIIVKLTKFHHMTEKLSQK